MNTITAIGTLLVCLLATNLNCEECVDQNPLCPFWAIKKQCETNPKFMEKNCLAACNSNCKTKKITIIECKDNTTRCGPWAKAVKPNNCLNKVDYMMYHCPVSCGFCTKDNDTIKYPPGVETPAGVTLPPATTTTASTTQTSTSISTSTSKAPATAKAIPIAAGADQVDKILGAHNTARMALKPAPADLKWDAAGLEKTQAKALGCDMSKADPNADNTCILTGTSAPTSGKDVATAMTTCSADIRTPANKGWANNKVVSDKFTHVGCAAASCPTIKGGTDSTTPTRGTLVVCSYKTVVESKPGPLEFPIPKKDAPDSASSKMLELHKTAKVPRPLPKTLPKDSMTYDEALATKAQDVARKCKPSASDSLRSENFCVQKLITPLKADEKLLAQAEMVKCLAKAVKGTDSVTFIEDGVDDTTKSCGKGQSCPNFAKIADSKIVKVGCGTAQCPNLCLNGKTEKTCNAQSLLVICQYQRELSQSPLKGDTKSSTKNEQASNAQPIFGARGPCDAAERCTNSKGAIIESNQVQCICPDTHPTCGVLARCSDGNYCLDKNGDNTIAPE